MALPRCLDALRTVDRELRTVDAMLADMHLPRLAARGVTGVDYPTRFAKVVPTDGWLPVDATIRIGDVAAVTLEIVPECAPPGSGIVGDQRVERVAEELEAFEAVADRLATIVGHGVHSTRRAAAPWS